MRENIKEKAGLVYNVVESVILAMSVGMMIWLANTVIAHGQSISVNSIRTDDGIRRIETLETRGSRSLESYSRGTDSAITDMQARLSKVENAVVALQATPGELKSINIILGNLKDGQERIEKLVTEHINKDKP